jgi:hypothetical protein
MATAACASEPGNYYGSVQPAYDEYAQPGYVQPGPGYIQPGYVPPTYAEPGYLVPDGGGPRYVPQYGYPVAPGFGYGYGRGRDPGFRDREFRRDFQERREFQDRGERERRFRDDQGPFNRGRFEGNRNFERPRPPEPPRQPPPPPPPGQTPPMPGGIFPGVPRPMPR